jgi:hypothetical protein
MACIVHFQGSVGQLRKKLRWTMNFTKNIKWQLALAALGVSFFMTGAARAQEIYNTDFSTPTTSVGENFNTPTAAAANTAVTNPQVQYTAVSEAPIMPANQTEQASLAGFPRSLGSLIAIGLALIACGIVWKNSGNRQNDILKSHNSLSMRKSPLSNRKAQALQS